MIYNTLIKDMNTYLIVQDGMTEILAVVPLLGYKISDPTMEFAYTGLNLPGAIIGTVDGIITLTSSGLSQLLNLWSAAYNEKPVDASMMFGSTTGLALVEEFQATQFRYSYLCPVTGGRINPSPHSGNLFIPPAVLNPTKPISQRHAAANAQLSANIETLVVERTTT